MGRINIKRIGKRKNIHKEKEGPENETGSKHEYCLKEGSSDQELYLSVQQGATTLKWS